MRIHKDLIDPKWQEICALIQSRLFSMQEVFVFRENALRQLHAKMEEIGFNEVMKREILDTLFQATQAVCSILYPPLKMLIFRRA